MALHVNQQRAVVLMSHGRDTDSIAKELDISRMTLCRWNHIPEFKQTLDKTVAENMAGMRTQVQLSAQVFVEGGLEAGQQLRHMILKPNTTDTERRLSSMTLLRHTQRFWDLMGFNAKLPNATSLLNDKLSELQESEAVEKVPFPHPNDRVPGDRTDRHATEQDRAEPGACAGFMPDYVHDWRTNPVNDDGTPKTEPAPKAPNAYQPPEYDPTRTVKAQVEEEIAACIKHAEAAQVAEEPVTIKPASYRPKPKLWKRSATTTRCKPAKSKSPSSRTSPNCPTITAAPTTSATHSPTRPQVSKTNATLAAAHGTG